MFRDIFEDNVARIQIQGEPIMSAIFGFIVPGTLALDEDERKVTAQFADVDGHRETLVARDVETLEEITHMIRDQIRFKVCVRMGRMKMVDSEIITPDANGKTAKTQDGMVVFFPMKMDVPANVPCEGKFYGAEEKGAFHAFGMNVSIPEPAPEQTPNL